jgi:glutamine cyclotransferase
MKIVSARALLIIACTALALSGCRKGEQTSSVQFRVVSQTPHDPAAYTQGLLLDDTVLYESTGQYGHSDVRRVDPATGQVLQTTPLPPNRFGEGLALLGGKLYQLTWQSQVAYVYDKVTLALVDSIHYPGEGWGLATDGTNLIMSDGSDSLRIMKPDFTVLRTVHVRYRGSPLTQLNELEYIDGDVFANVYQSDWIVRLDPQTGNAKQILDFADLYLARSPEAEVMNGIASTGKAGELFVTGKYWPVMFRVALTSPSNQGITR